MNKTQIVATTLNKNAAKNVSKYMMHKLSIFVFAIAITFVGTMKPVEVAANCRYMEASVSIINDCCIEIKITPPRYAPAAVLIRQIDKNGNIVKGNYPNHGTGYPYVPFDPETMVKIDWPTPSNPNHYYIFPKTHGLIYPDAPYFDTLCILPGENQIRYWLSVEYAMDDRGLCPYIYGTIQMPNAQNCCPCPDDMSDWLTLETVYQESGEC
ncbi:MAG: hypothetical protein FWC41_14210, partial [Firmicutes bacterium]|nr:hypothetical protein [Bacillota bacterium]